MGMREFGDLIRQAREAKKIRAYDLAYTIEQSPSWVSKLERGDLTHPPSPVVLGGLARVLGVPQVRMLRSLGYLTDDAPVDASDGPSDEFSQRTKDWPPIQRELIWRYIDAIDVALDALESSEDDERAESVS